MARGSSVTPVWRPKRKVCSTTAAADANAASTSPTSSLRSKVKLSPRSGWITGVPASSAVSMSVTAGSSSKSTATSSTASSAARRLAATTATTASPCQQARSTASGCCGADLIPWRCASTPTHGLQSLASSAPVTTRMTPDLRAAAAGCARYSCSAGRGPRRRRTWAQRCSKSCSLPLVSHRLDRIDDRLIAGAPAVVAGQVGADLGAGRVRPGREQLGRGEQHAGRAIAALQRVALEEGVLEVDDLAILGQALDGIDPQSVGLGGEHQTAAHDLPLNPDRARPAHAVLAADVRAGEL